MGFLDWIFGKGTQSNIGRQQESWTRSERGNAMMLVGEDSGRGWKFCIADANGDDSDPYYSDRYDHEDAAKYEALAHYKSLPSRYHSKVEQSASRREEREAKTLEISRDYIASRKPILYEIMRDLSPAPTTLTGLRKLERKAASAIKGLTSFRRELYIASVNDSELHSVDRLIEDFQRRADEIEGLIGAAKSRRPSR